MYKKILNVILVILVIAILGAGGYFIYTRWDIHKKNSDAEQFLEEEFDQLIVKVSDDSTEIEQFDEQNPSNNVQEPTTNNENNNNSNNNSVPLKYKGYPVAGKIEIPKTGIKYPILEETSSAKALDISVVKIYGPKLNMPGNVVIAGHNNNNSLFFGKNKNLQIGDKIYITDMKGNRKEYTIFNKYYTPGDDYSYVTKNTNGALEITLYTCDATGKNRLIICARAE